MLSAFFSPSSGGALHAILGASTLAVACSDPSSEIAEATRFCEAEPEVFEASGFLNGRAEFDFSNGVVHSEGAIENLREFELRYPLKPLRLVTLLAVQANGGRAFGDGIELLDGAPDHLVEPFAGSAPSSGEIVVYRQPDAADCSVSEAMLGFVDDYLSFVEGHGHIEPWPASGALSIGYYGLHIWSGSTDELRAVRGQIADLIDQRRCLTYHATNSQIRPPIAQSTGSETEDSGFILTVAENVISLNGQILYQYRDAVVYPANRPAEIHFYCCNAALPGACSVPAAWTANAIAMNSEYEVQND
jgi:hypothetical protein